MNALSISEYLHPQTIQSHRSVLNFAFNTVPKMSPVDMAVECTNFMSQFSQLVASETDFGGYAGPAGSLVFIGILILTLSPPLADPDQM